jgi:stearoyl-CoA desaturase (delta-9 desaturase)
MVDSVFLTAMAFKHYIRPNKLLVTLVQLMFPLALYLAVTSHAEWYWWLTAFVFYFLYVCVGNNIGMHRYFCHQHFEANKFVEYLFVWTAGMSIMGSPLSWPVTHLHHHIHSDTDLDLHGPKVGLRSLLFYFYKDVPIDEKVLNNKRVADLNLQYGWLHRYYWLYVIANLIVFALLGYKVFLFVWFLPATFSLWVISYSIYIQHCPNGASNNRWYLWIGLGEGLHYNHHQRPGQSDTAMNPKEFDYIHWISKLFAKRFY